MRDRPGSTTFAYVLLRVLLPAALILAVVWYGAVHGLRSSLEQDAQSRLQALADKEANVLEERIATITAAAAALAENAIMVNGLIDGGPQLSYLHTFFASLRMPGQAEAAITLVDYRGRRLAANKAGSSYQDSAWMPEVMAGNMVTKVSIAGLITVIPIHYNGRPEGALMVNYTAGELAKVLRDPSAPATTAITGAGGGCCSPLQARHSARPLKAARAEALRAGFA